MQVFTDVALPASLEHETDINELAKYGFVRKPTLVID